MKKDLKTFMEIILTLMAGYFFMRFLLSLIITLNKIVAIVLVISLMVIFIAEIMYVNKRNK